MWEVVEASVSEPEFAAEARAWAAGIVSCFALRVCEFCVLCDERVGFCSALTVCVLCVFDERVGCQG